MTAQAKISAEHKNVFVALCAAQLEFGSVQKGSINPAFKSKYADLSDVTSVVVPVLARHGVAVLHYIKTVEGQSFMRTEFMHGETTTRVWCDVPLMVDRQNMQGMKSATTYAKRIGLESLSGIAPDDDDGNAAAKAAPRQQQKPANDAADQAKAYLTEADTLADLADRWGKLPKETQRIPAVISAKDARKDELKPKEPKQSPITDDEIPHQ